MKQTHQVQMALGRKQAAARASSLRVLLRCPVSDLQSLAGQLRVHTQRRAQRATPPPALRSDLASLAASLSSSKARCIFSMLHLSPWKEEGPPARGPSSGTLTQVLRRPVLGRRRMASMRALGRSSNAARGRYYGKLV